MAPGDSSCLCLLQVALGDLRPSPTHPGLQTQRPLCCQGQGPPLCSLGRRHPVATLSCNLVSVGPHHDGICKQNLAQGLCSRSPGAVASDPLNRPKGSGEMWPCHMLLETFTSEEPSAALATDHPPDRCRWAINPNGPPSWQTAAWEGESQLPPGSQLGRIQAPHLHTTAGPSHRPSKVLRLRRGSSIKPWEEAAKVRRISGGLSFRDAEAPRLGTPRAGVDRSVVPPCCPQPLSSLCSLTQLSPLLLSAGCGHQPGRGHPCP